MTLGLLFCVNEADAAAGVAVPETVAEGVPDALSEPVRDGERVPETVVDCVRVSDVVCEEDPDRVNVEACEGVPLCACVWEGVAPCDFDCDDEAACVSVDVEDCDGVRVELAARVALGVGLALCDAVAETLLL